MEKKNNRKKDVEGFFQHHFFPTKKDVEGFTQHYFFSKKSSAGFTLIELLIVVAIIAILASVIFVALNPLTRFQDSRDSVRWQDVSAISQAIKLDQVDNGGNYLYAIANMTSGTVYMISSVGTLSGCDNNNIYCDVNVDSDGACVDLSGLVVDGYIGKVPVSPNGDPDVTWGENITGYTLERESSGIIHVRACERENSNEIIISR